MDVTAHLKRASLAVLGLLFLGCSDSAGPPGGFQALNHDPILFVHGFGGSSRNFDQMRARFVADGWRDGVELFAFNYSSTVTNAAAAQEIRNQVNHILETTGAERVDIIAHEMGSLSSRFYIRNFGGTETIDAWASLGGPNHGTILYTRCSNIPCQEMAPKSAFMTMLNAEVEGEPPVRYATWRSPCDELVQPHESVAVWDAANFITACMSNANLIADAAIYRQVKEFVQQVVPRL